MRVSAGSGLRIALAALAAVAVAAGAARWALAPRVRVVPPPPDGLQDWNPLLQPDPPLAALLYRGLVRLDATGRPVPDLARGWIVQDGGRTWIFPLRPGLRFSTGAAVRAADAGSAMRAMADPASGAPSGRLWWGREVDAVAGGTAVRVRLPWPDPAFLWEVAGVPVVPAARARTRGGGPPPGSGPYVLRTSRPDGADLAPNPVAGGGPGARDLAVRWRPARPDAARDVFLLVFNARRGPWSTVTARRAWAAAIDRRAVARAAGGRAVGGLFPPGTWASSGAAATGLPRSRIGGTAVLLYPGARRGAAGAAAALAGAFQQAGASVRLEAADTSRLLAALQAPHDFDLLLTDWPFGPDLEAAPLLQSAGALNASGWASPEADRLLAEMDGACPREGTPTDSPTAAVMPPPDLGYRVAALLGCAGDLEARASAAAALSRLVAHDAPVVPLYTPGKD